MPRSPTRAAPARSPATTCSRYSPDAMRRWFLLALLVACKSSAKAPPPGPPAQKGSEVHVDHRVELVSIVMRLAGAPEYKLADRTDYVSDVDKQLGAFADHKAVAMARELEAKGIGYDAPIALAVHLDDPNVEQT